MAAVGESVVREFLQKVLASSAFASSPRMSGFLRFIVEETLAGRADRIKEYTIGVEVFGKPPSYDPHTDSTVRTEASKLRSKLNAYYETDGRAEPRVIEIPKGGYVPTFHPRVQAKRFSGRRIAPVAAVVAAVITGSVVYWVAIATRQPVQPASTLSVAVLPFRDLTASQDKEYLCDGITEELIASLTSLTGLRVASHTSISRYKGTATDVVRIGKDLNVQAIVEGSLRIEGNHVRVLARLLNTRDGFHLWTFTHEGEMDGTSDIQHQTADAIFRTFRKELKTTRRALVRPASGNTEAWHHYIRAAFLSGRQPVKALEFYHAAVTADPGYALAWAGLSLSAAIAVDWGEGRPAEMFPKARDAARRALALDPKLPEAHQAIARVKVYCEHDWAGAEVAFRRAIELDPTYQDARLHYAMLVLIPTGRFNEAVEELHRALALYPDSNHLLNQLASAHIKARQYDKATPYLEASVKIQQGQLTPWVYLGIAASGRGDYQQALGIFQKAASISRTAWVLSHLGYTYAKLGRRGDALHIIDELEQTYAGKPTYDYEIAAIHGALGDRDTAFAALDRAVANQAEGLVWLKVDYLLDDLREDPRFGMLLEKMRLD